MILMSPIQFTLAPTPRQHPQHQATQQRAIKSKLKSLIFVYDDGENICMKIYLSAPKKLSFFFIHIFYIQSLTDRRPSCFCLTCSLSPENICVQFRSHIENIKSQSNEWVKQHNIYPHVIIQCVAHNCVQVYNKCVPTYKRCTTHGYLVNDFWFLSFTLFFGSLLLTFGWVEIIIQTNEIFLFFYIYAVFQ